MMLKKRGLSQVVTTLLIILVAIVAIGIIWVVIRNIIGQGTSEIGIERFSLDLGIQSAYINGQEVIVVVRRSVGQGDLTGVYFIFHNGTSSKNVEKIISLQQLEEKTFTFSLEEVGGLENAQLVSVSPIFSSGGDKQIGDITDTQEISNSLPGSGEQGDGETSFCDNDSVCDPDESAISCPVDCGAGTPLCPNEICDAGETPESCPADCAVPNSCNGVWEGASEDLGVECDGGGTPGNVPNCLATCTCALGYIPSGSGTCIPESSLNNGAIDSIWPFGAVKYFDSENLPKDSVTIQSYIGKYVNFSGTESRCLQISYAEYLSDPAYNKGYIRIELPATIASGDNYEIWLSSSCGA